jgi:hypothetical protein
MSCKRFCDCVSGVTSERRGLPLRAAGVDLEGLGVAVVGVATAVVDRRPRRMPRFEAGVVVWGDFSGVRRGAGVAGLRLLPLSGLARPLRKSRNMVFNE